MTAMNLQRLDLNLLKVLDALERDRSVTKAAKRLGIGQPAVSHALGRLRELTQDRLFTRGGAGIEPTAHALSLIEPVRSALAQVEEGFFGSKSFDAQGSVDRFCIGMSDFTAVTVLPTLTRALQRAAPNATITVRACDRTNAVQMLDNRQVDIAIGYFPGVESWQRAHPLFEEDHCCLFNPKLVKVKTPITLKQYLAYPHMLVTHSGDERGLIDDVLSRRKVSRTVLISSPYFLLACYLLHQLPLIAALPRHYAKMSAVTSKLAISELPFETPGFTVSMIWHKRDNANARQRFLRDLVVGAINPGR